MEREDEQQLRGEEEEEEDTLASERGEHGVRVQRE